ncbi:MAG: GIY-YIG nuclease family protein [Candidatus Methanomethylophilaceae archaeon]
MRKGTYVLAISLGEPFAREVGSLGTVSLEKGQYCYVGSAMNGLDQRIERHLRRNKSIRWHIDRLTSFEGDVKAYESYPDSIPECRLAEIAVSCGMEPAAKGFGCSDCKCQTHLFRATGDSLRKLVAEAGLKEFRLKGSR